MNASRTRLAIAELTSIALSSGGGDTRYSHTSEAIQDVLEGVIALSSATGILAEVRRVDVSDHARAIINAQNHSPQNPASSGAFRRPPEL